MQRKTFTELNEENKKLRDELDGLQREKNKLRMETIKEVGEELAKGLDKERDDLKQQLAASAKEIVSLKAKMHEELAGRAKAMEQMQKENKKMKEYIDTLIRTRADNLKIVAMERMLNDMVLQLSKLGEKCSYQQAELDKKEKEAQEMHKAMQKFERENKSHTATIKYLTGRIELYGKGSEGQRKGGLRESEKVKGVYDVLPKTKIVKPIKGGAPAVVPKYTKNHSLVPQLRLDSLTQEGGTRRISILDKGMPLLTQRASVSDLKSKVYEQNLRKFDMLVETQTSRNSKPVLDDVSEGKKESQCLEEKLFG
eukprot:TRINITY_DN3201_c0_g1_i8.p2 TRINITY_DN3201_c0_g1~~TRINITY_DN3201_c0_g1_i8.p2  ORF type:complete len:311 (+),score=127.66 TRINITY_DN3201_c0_g1_i8:2074-3006(+)